jgi:hypothetical protein
MLSAGALACLPLVLAVVPASQARAATITVNNCNDTGAGSLRDAVARAVSGDTVDMRSLRCRHILVLAGSIDIPQDNLALLGPGRALLIDGNAERSVLRHGGSGTLLIRSLSVGYGHFRSSGARGGCIASSGNITLQNVRVHHCIAEGDRGLEPFAQGGGIYASGNVSLADSDVFSNTVMANDAGGGGIHAYGLLTLVRSRVFLNSAPHGGYGGAAGRGGLRMSYSEVSGNQAMDIAGVYGFGNSTVSHSAIVHNSATLRHGGAYLEGGEGHEMRVIDSTISDNSAPTGSGLVMQGADATKSVVSSTIAYNREHPDTESCVGALDMTGLLHIDSSIVARNRCGERPADILDTPDFARLEGADNLIEVSTLPVPPGTISANPRLAALAQNGGPTRTRALLSDSPAIDMGNNVGGLATDQRGPGFPRVKGMRADIGAFER